MKSILMSLGQDTLKHGFMECVCERDRESGRSPVCMRGRAWNSQGPPTKSCPRAKFFRWTVNRLLVERAFGLEGHGLAHTRAHT